MHILFLSNEGLSATIFESQVLTVARLAREQGLSVRVLAMALTREKYLHAQRVRAAYEEKYNVPITVLRAVSQQLPGSVALNARRVKKVLQVLGESPRLIQGRSEYAAAVAVQLRSSLGCPVIWDCRGDTVAELYFRWRRRPAWLRWLVLLGDLRLRPWLGAAGRADGAIFVSDALRDVEVARGYRGVSVVVPNYADPALFRFDPQLRARTRKRLHIPEADRVFVYVGSGAPWQGLEDMRGILRGMIQSRDDTSLLLVCDRPDEALEQFAGWNTTKIRATSATLQEVPHYLNAGDVAMLLRAAGPASEVASPIKFAEYAMCGLPVVHNGSVAQVREFSERLGGANVLLRDQGDMDSLTPLDDTERARRASMARPLLSNENTGQILGAFWASYLGPPPAQGRG